MAGRHRRPLAAFSVATHAEGPTAADRRMERYHERVGRRRTERAVWPGAAFIVEALLLLVFLAGSLAVLMNVNAAADRTGREATDLCAALTMASNAAESFAADPAAAAISPAGPVTESDGNIVHGDGLLLVREVSAETTRSGIYYHALITVWDEDDVTGVASPDETAAYDVVLAQSAADPIYMVETSRYLPGEDSPVTGGTPLADVRGSEVVDVIEEVL